MEARPTCAVYAGRAETWLWSNYCEKKASSTKVQRNATEEQTTYSVIPGNHHSLSKFLSIKVELVQAYLAAVRTRSDLGS